MGRRLWVREKKVRRWRLGGRRRVMSEKKESVLMLTDGRKGACEGEEKARLGEVNGVS